MFGAADGIKFPLALFTERALSGRQISDWFLFGGLKTTHSACWLSFVG